MGTRIEHTFATRIGIPAQQCDKLVDLLSARPADTCVIDEHLWFVETHRQGD